jgi:hypothetical protein
LVGTLVLLWNKKISTILALHGLRSSADQKETSYLMVTQLCKEAPNT